MKHHSKLYHLTAGLIALSLVSACAGENRDPVAPTGDAILDLLNASNVPGVSIAIIKNFQIDKLKVYGVADQLTQTPVTKDTLFQAASISKSLTAVAALKMVENGHFTLDENINNSLSSWQVPDNNFTMTTKVSMGSLLGHTAGTSVQGFLGYKPGQSVPSLMQILNGQGPANSAPVRVVRVPGVSYSYSGGGYCIVQQSIEDTSFQSFAEVMQAMVLTPLDMTHSSFELSSLSNLELPISSGHEENGSPLQGNYRIHPELAAAGLWTTAEDLAKLLIELQLSLTNQSNKILSREMTELMITPTSVPDYGMGLQLFGDGVKTHFGHTGHNIGFHSIMFGDLSDGSGIVLLANGEDAGDNNFLSRLVDIIVNEEF